MSKVDKLRDEMDKLEDSIKLSVKEFVKEFGECSVKISTGISFEKEKESDVSQLVDIHVTTLITL